MSTDHQRYSIENQAAVIATYAQLHGLEIVHTYRDEGESGLRIKNRKGLIDLIGDVRSGSADFSHILVYDVSRWGRFQDTDESAHYEFLCKQAGIKVAYCAEQFENDGSLLSSIMKNLKRVMAAEFSRELSAKVHAGKLRGAALGFRQGGPIGYGLRRELVNEQRISKGLLNRGEQKNLSEDRVILRLGPAEEQFIVQRIFHQFVERVPDEEIARQLNREGVPNHLGRPWNGKLIHFLLKNENYVGNNVYNRCSFKLKEKKTTNPPIQWVRSKDILPPVVDKSLFLRAQRILALRYLSLTDEEMLERLKALLDKQGRLTSKLIDHTLGVPCVTIYYKRFGSLRNAYRLIGYRPTRDVDWIERKDTFRAFLTDVAAEIAARLEKSGWRVRYEPGVDVMTFNEQLSVSLRLARCWKGDRQSPGWSIYRRVKLPTGLIVVIRLNEDNRSIRDYYLIPTGVMKKRRLRFNEVGQCKFDAYRFRTITPLALSIGRWLRTVGTKSRSRLRSTTATTSRPPRRE